ncbi:MAG: hypothetical protein ACOCPT_03125 [Halanaeroarchaeum sp.]
METLENRYPDDDSPAFLRSTGTVRDRDGDGTTVALVRVANAPGGFHGESQVLVTERRVAAFTGTDDIGEHRRRDAP